MPDFLIKRRKGMSTEIGNFESKAHPKDLVLKRTLKAPRALVFDAFTRAEHLVH
jgi:hypothetical protein